MTRLAAACVSASARSKSNDNTKHVELPVEGFWTRVRFPPPPPTKRPPLRWFFSWWVQVVSTRVHAGRGQGFIKHSLTLAERASDVTRAPAYEQIPAIGYGVRITRARSAVDTCYRHVNVFCQSIRGQPQRLEEFSLRHFARRNWCSFFHGNRINSKMTDRDGRKLWRVQWLLIQFSTTKPEKPRKSASLLVTSITPSDSACDAMSLSNASLLRSRLAARSGP